MLIEFKNSVEEHFFEDFLGGEVFLNRGEETFIVLSEEIFDSGSRARYNAVNLETGEPAYFAANEKVICPNDYTLTVEL